MRGTSFVAAILIVAGTSTSGAQDHPNVAKGLYGARKLDLSQLDAVNLFNGALSIRIPISGEIPVESNFSYEIGLHYSSQAWDPREEFNNTVAGRASRTQNAGLGWTLSLGRILTPNGVLNPDDELLYLAPDGSRVRFFDTLHQEDADDPGDSSSWQGVRYARDGSFRRLQVQGPPTTSYRLEFPDGTTQHFDVSGRLTAISDPYGTRVTVAYEIEAGTNDEIWTIDDTHRTHTVRLQRVNIDGVIRHIVTEVDLEAFEGARALWQFFYTWNSVPRPCPETDPNTSANVNVPFLTEVRPPDGGSFLMPAATSYVLAPAPADCKLTGVLKRMQLPTRGAIEWDPQVVFLPEESVAPDNPEDLRRHHSRSVGVARRRTVLADNTVEGEWLYSHQLQGGSPAPNPSPARWKTTTVVTPLSDKTVSYFSVWPEPSTGTNGYVRKEYGLPFTREVTESGTATFLSTEVFDCTYNPLDPPNPTCPANPVRRTYVRYEADTGANTVDLEDLVYSNQRLAETTVVYEDDTVQGGAKVYANTVLTDYDGLGHYRTTTLAGNFGSGDSRVTTTTYNEGQSYPGSYTPPAPTDPWILGTFDRIQVTQGSDSSDTRYYFDSGPSTGFLDCARTLKTPGTLGVNDILVRYTRDNDATPTGNITQERVYGGDVTPITVADACSAGSTLEYTTTYEYSGGIRSSAQRSGIGFKSLDLTVDASSGLPKFTRDAAGIETQLSYDLLGRLVSAKPQVQGAIAADAWTSIDYEPATATTAAWMEIFRCTPGTSACDRNNTANAVTYDYVEFDSLGRVYKEERLLPDETWNRQFTWYDAAGNRRKVTSTYGPGTQPPDIPATSYEDFDPFGRPRRVVLPDDRQIETSYLGDRWVGTTTDIGTALDGTLDDVTRWEGYDRQGRLWRVIEDVGENTTTSEATTEYSYDEGGRLKKVCQNKSGGSCGQERIFEYDPRGFLTSEKHPEVGASGNGTFYFCQYDSMGNPRRRRNAACGTQNASFGLWFTYDALERLRTVKEEGVNGTQGSLVKELVYDGGLGAGEGRVQTAKRWTYLPAPINSTYLVTETNEYQGRGGRPSKRTTQMTVGSATAEAWVFSAQYDPLGNVSQLQYPTCAGASCGSGQGTPARSQTFTYARGLLTAIPGWASSISYHPNLMVAEVAHVNNTKEVVANDPDGMLRPQSIAVKSTSPVTTLWQTGTYAFDDGGNILSMTGTATDRYRYDRASRLREADLDSVSSNAAQTVTFDVYGNLTQATTNGTGISFNTDAATNHLQSQVGNLVSYGLTGNLTDWNGNRYGYDRLDSMTTLCTNFVGSSCVGELWGYVYTADGERILSFRHGTAQQFWTIRDFAGRLLTRDERLATPGLVESPQLQPCTGAQPGETGVFCDNFETGNTGGWSTTSQGTLRKVTDYVFRGDLLVGANTLNESVRHYGLDHLGTVRLVTNDIGEVVAQHTYFPFGREATAPVAGAEVMRFTGHERDLQSTPTATADDLDHMHARTYSPLTGRFLAVDPKAHRSPQEKPQLFNRYQYALGNPQTYVDPDGRQAAAHMFSQKLALAAERLYIQGLLRPTEKNPVGPVVPGNWIARAAGTSRGATIGIKGLQWLAVDLTDVLEGGDTINATAQSRGLGVSLDLKFEGAFVSDAEVSLLGGPFSLGLTGQGNELTTGVGAVVGYEWSWDVDSMAQSLFESMLTMSTEELLVEVAVEAAGSEEASNHEKTDPAAPPQTPGNGRE
jgi:RHS repeat-associated protein